MIGWLVIAFLLAIVMYILYALVVPQKGVKTMAACSQTDGVKRAAPMVDPQTKLDIETVEREVFAKADLVQKLVRGMIPVNGAAKAVYKPASPSEPADPATQPPDETAFLKAITDRVEQVKRLSKKQSIG